MYFINQYHEDTFYALMHFYGKKADDVQYQANMYIAAVPDIFALISQSKLNAESGPMATLVKYDEEKEKLVPSHPALTGSTRKLVEIGLSLFNGNSCDLDFSPSLEYGRVVIQAMKLRFRI